MSWLQTHEVAVPFLQACAGKHVFALQLRQRAVRPEDLARNWSSTTSTSSQFLEFAALDDENSRHSSNRLPQDMAVAHVTAVRSYSQFRHLWKDLLRATKPTSLGRAVSSEADPASTQRPRGGSWGISSRRRRRSSSPTQAENPQSRSTSSSATLSRSASAAESLLSSSLSSSSCRCSGSCCPFQSFHHFLKSYPFPSKLVMKRSTPEALEDRRRGLELFIATVRGLFDTFPRAFLQSVDATENCRVLTVLAAFLGFNQELRTGSVPRLQLQTPAWKADSREPRDYARQSANSSSNRSLHSSSSWSSNSSGSGASWSSRSRSTNGDSSTDTVQLPEELTTGYSAEFYLRQDGADASCHNSPLSASQGEPLSTWPEEAGNEDDEIGESTASNSGMSPCASWNSTTARRQTAYLTRSPVTRSFQRVYATTSKDQTTSLRPGLPKLQIRTAKVSTIRGFLEEFREHLLLDSRADVSDWDETKQWELALYVASQIGHSYAVESILFRGTNPNAVMEGGLSSLHAACRGRHRGIAEMLLAYGADPNAVDPKGVTPLLSAVQLGDLEIVELLLVCGANVNLRNHDNVSAVHVAVACQNLPALKLLLEHDAFVNTPNSFNGKTPLHLAAQCGDYAMCELLLRYGGNIRLRTVRGLGVVALARLHGNHRVADLCSGFRPCQELSLRCSSGSTKMTLTAAGASTAEDPREIVHEGGPGVAIVSEDGHSYAVM